MEIVFYCIAKTISIIMALGSFAMLARAIMPIFVDVDGNRVYAIAFAVSEPFVVPIRAIMQLLGIGQDSPFDWAFMIAYFVLYIIRSFLPAI